MLNKALRENQINNAVDHRSYKRQGVDLIPTIHKGVAATKMERRGIKTERGVINREILITNSQIKQLKARIIKLQNWIDEKTNSK